MSTKDGVLKATSLVNIGFKPAGGTMFASPMEKEDLAASLFKAQKDNAFIELQGYAVTPDGRGNLNINENTIVILGIDASTIQIFTIYSLIKSAGLSIAHAMPPQLDRKLQ